ncbi:MAG: hypothetical protein G01um101429_498 [Parcubacteria group bacterium Gr01-1014_29]|nr:MAG: hypothetical protein G01um101429_498 [Parcubacteria group bacterium Gr01-1014_29]
MKKFLEAKLPPSRLIWVLETIQPFLNRISMGEYPLVTANKVSKKEVHTAIQYAFGSGIRGIEVVDPTWNRTVPRTTLDEKLWAKLYHQRLLDTTTNRYKKEIRSPLWDTFTRPLAYTIAKTVPHEYVFFAIPYSLEFFIGLAVEGREETARSLVPLFNMCLQCIPFAERSDHQRGKWIVYAR